MMLRWPIVGALKKKRVSLAQKEEKDKKVSLEEKEEKEMEEWRC